MNNIKNLTKQEWLDTILPILKDCDGNSESDFEIKSFDDNLYSDLGMTSLTVVESIMLINEKFKIEITDNEIQLIKTVDDLINKIQKHIENGY